MVETTKGMQLSSSYSQGWVTGSDTDGGYMYTYMIRTYMHTSPPHLGRHQDYLEEDYQVCTAPDKPVIDYDDMNKLIFEASGPGFWLPIDILQTLTPCKRSGKPKLGSSVLLSKDVTSANVGVKLGSRPCSKHKLFDCGCKIL